ncbi:helix-turn-helix transcriptional regulator [Sulfitobacter sp. S190]|uniref:helix-turn-helix transcriptional regulator n=1 Tax=Sulfitobacter sp. S190 TaxID=2867022 RepID=UPI0021A7AD5C|nr:helix-turn-helix transcriptional regulator [Sulfitobacter sp. S190]UWR24436.1 helix-turn-helix transcriptional regulator [Sulfitobacter sp. S190]
MKQKTQEYRDFANQLAASAGVDAMYMGVFDSYAGYFLDHWAGFGAAGDCARVTSAGDSLTVLTQAMRTISLRRKRGQDTCAETLRRIDAAPFEITIGEPRGHLYPVVAVLGGETAGRRASLDALLPVALSFVSEQLKHLTGAKGQRNRRLIDTALRVLSVHFAVVDRNGMIDCCANISDDWLANHGGFEIDKERLIARSPKVQDAFQQALDLATGPEGKSSIVSLRNDEGPARMVWVSHLAEFAEPRALVILGRGRENSALRDHLLKLSGLTAAERRVACHILRGKSLGETAEETNLALSTVRSYMKRILAKTSTRRQSEFVSRYQGALSRMAIAPSETPPEQRH